MVILVHPPTPIMFTEKEISKALAVDVKIQQLNVSKTGFTVKFLAAPKHIQGLIRNFTRRDIDHIYIESELKLTILTQGIWDFCRLVFHVNGYFDYYLPGVTLVLNDSTHSITEKQISRFFGKESRKIRYVTRVIDGSYWISFRPSAMGGAHIDSISSQLKQRGITNHIFPRIGIRIHSAASKLFIYLVRRVKLRCATKVSIESVATALGVKSTCIRRIRMKNRVCRINFTISYQLYRQLEAMAQKLEALGIMCCWTPHHLDIYEPSISRFHAYVKQVTTSMKIR